MRMRARLFQARASQGGSVGIAAMGSLSRFCGARMRAQVEPLLWSSYVLMAVGMQAAARSRVDYPASLGRLPESSTVARDKHWLETSSIHATFKVKPE